MRSAERTSAATSTAGASSLALAGLHDAQRYFAVARAVDEAGNEDRNTVERSAVTVAR